LHKIRDEKKRGNSIVMSTFMNPLPPQAYTKETLVHAYAWLQNQSENIKELATTPDVLVSLYLKAKLQGDGALERPSIQNFKNELKNLAGMMGEFEVLESPAGSPGSNSGHQTVRIRSQDLRTNESKAEEKQPQQTPSQSSFSSRMASLASSQAPQGIQTTAENLPGLDSRSLDMIQEVKIQFNLSSDSEAQRLLLAIGYNQIKGLLR
jgi:hypothetical protein